jgi:hypothetical protein
LFEPGKDSEACGEKGRGLPRPGDPEEFYSHKALPPQGQERQLALFEEIANRVPSAPQTAVRLGQTAVSESRDKGKGRVLDQTKSAAGKEVLVRGRRSLRRAQKGKGPPIQVEILHSNTGDNAGRVLTALRLLLAKKDDV